MNPLPRSFSVPSLCALLLLASPSWSSAQSAEHGSARTAIQRAVAARLASNRSEAPAPEKVNPGKTAPAERAPAPVARPEPAPKVAPIPVPPVPVGLVPAIPSVAATVLPSASIRPPAQLRGAVAIPQRSAAAADSVPSDSVPEAKAPAAAPAAIVVGVGTVKFSGLLQAWYMGGNQEFTNTFRLRRAELKFVGEITPSAKWTLMVDPAKAVSVSNTFATIGDTKVVTDGVVKPGSNLLQDAFITLSGIGLEFSAGQFKLPIGLEGGSQSSAKLETVERGLFMARGKLGGNRDLGVMVSGPLSSDMDFQLGFFNGTGSGQNTIDTDDQKALAGRVVLRTALPGLHLGASGAWSGIAADQGTRSDRLGGELLFQNGPLMLKSEVMNGWDGDSHGVGFYGHAGFKLTPAIEAVARYDVWNPNTDLDDSAKTTIERDYIAGINYYIAGANVKLQANYIHKTFDAFADTQDLLLLNLQTSW